MAAIGEYSVDVGSDVRMAYEREGEPMQRAETSTSTSMDRQIDR